MSYELINEASHLVAEGVVNNGGATVHPVTLATPVAGYAVSRSGAEESYSFRRPAADSDLAYAAALVRGYIDRHREALLAQAGSQYVGAWIDSGRLYLDTTEVIADRSEALRLAAENGQRAIHDLAAGEDIFL